MNFEYHHTGYACKDIDRCLKFVDSIFGISKKTDIIYDEQQDANVCLTKYSTLCAFPRDDGCSIVFTCRLFVALALSLFFDPVQYSNFSASYELVNCL